MSNWLNYTFSTGRQWLGSLNGPLTFLSLLIGLAFAYFALVEWRVEKIVKDPSFMAEVARRVRPAVVFNAEGTVIADSGAMDLLESAPTVKMAQRDGTLTIAKIFVVPKRVIAEPILESLDLSNVSVAAKRAMGLSWEITVVARWESVASEDSPSVLLPARFRLELESR